MRKKRYKRVIILALVHQRMLNNPGRSFASADHEGRVCSGDAMGCGRLSGNRVLGPFVREYPLDAWELQWAEGPGADTSQGEH